MGNVEIIKGEWIHVSNLITSHSYEISVSASIINDEG